MDTFVKGSCMKMCSLQELEMRQKERLLHKLEIFDGTERDKYPKADPNKTVKCYSRSAADMNMARAHLLRPFSVLKTTVDYLIEKVLPKQDVSDLMKYNFISDRLRAIRQDMVIQSLPPAQCIQLLEPMVLFHTLYGYKLCDKSTNDYDPVLNRKQLLEYIKHVLVCYDTIGNDLGSQKLEEHFMDLQIANETEAIKMPAIHRSIIESLYILINLSDLNPLYRYCKIGKNLRFSSVNLSYSISVEAMRGNYVRVCRLARQLSPIELCAFCLHVPHIQRNVLRVLSEAYSSKQLLFPLSALCTWCLFNSEEEVRQVCQYYGLRYQTEGVLFSKSDFKDCKFLPPKKLEFFEEPNCIEHKGVS